MQYERKIKAFYFQQTVSSFSSTNSWFSRYRSEKTRWRCNETFYGFMVFLQLCLFLTHSQRLCSHAIAAFANQIDFHPLFLYTILHKNEFNEPKADSILEFFMLKQSLKQTIKQIVEIVVKIKLTTHIRFFKFVVPVFTFRTFERFLHKSDI